MALLVLPFVFTLARALLGVIGQAHDARQFRTLQAPEGGRADPTYRAELGAHDIHSGGVAGVTLLITWAGV
jgi:hypothetical protein